MSLEFHAPRPCNVLIVDDSESNLLALTAVLEPLGQRLYEARSGEEALRLALDREFAVILLDVQMPGMSGLETAAAIKKRKRSRYTPIIFMTAERDDLGARAQGYAYGAVDFVTKPFDPEVMRSKVAVFVELYIRGERIKEQEARLRLRAEEQLRVVVNNAPILLFALDGQGRVTLAEGSGLDVLGLKAAKGLGRPLGEVLGDEPAFLEHAARALRGEHHTSLERFSGLDLVYEVRWVPVRSEDGAAVTGAVGVATNVTERVRAEEDRLRLMAQERRAHEVAINQQKWLETLLDRMPAALLLIEPGSADVLFANRAADELAGTQIPRGVPPGTPAFVCTTESGEAIVEGDLPMRRAARGEELRGFEMDWHTPRGKRSIVVYSACMPGIYGHSEIVVLTFVDVSELKEIEAELQNAVRVRDDFLSIASHELITPLTPLKMQIGTLLRKKVPDDNLRTRLHSLDRQVDRMTKLVNQLLDVTRITGGKLRLAPEPMDLTAAVREVAATFGDELERSGSSLLLRAHDPILGAWDPMRIEHVIVNLIANAIKYGAGKPITIDTSIVDGMAQIVVLDHGIGIEPPQLSRIFERFERAVSVRHYGGFGLGLWIVRQVVEASGGTVRVESQVGAGSKFTVRLPLSKALEEPPGTSDRLGTSGRT